MNISIKLQPKQIELYKLICNSTHRWIGYGGARGGAKSHAIRDISITFALKYPKSSILIFRRTYDELLGNHILKFYQFYPELMQEYYKSSERTIYLPNGSMIKFGYAQYEQDIFTFQGKEFDLIFCDEATRMSEAMITELKVCNRSPVLSQQGFTPKFVCTMNPGGESHAFNKRIFIDKDYKDNENANDYAFLNAYVWDNVIWSLTELRNQNISVQTYYKEWTDEQRKEFTIKYSDYAKALSTLPEQLREAYLEGNWEVFGGQFFKGFNKKTQIIEPFIIPEQWELIGSIDPGFSSPCSFGLTAKDFEGNLYRVFTYYEEQKSAEEHAESINERIKNCVYTKGRKPIRIVSGRDAFAKKDKYSVLANEVTFSDVFQNAGLILTPAVTDRILGWWTWKGLIPSKYYIFDKDNFGVPMNFALVEEIQNTVADDKFVEDIKGKGNDANVPDHALDEQRYGIMSLYKPHVIIENPPIPRGTRQDAISYNKNNNPYANF